MDILNLFLEPIQAILPKIPSTLLNLIIGYIAIQVTLWIVASLLHLTSLPRLRGIILSLIRLALWVILIIFLANNLGFDKLAIAISGSALVLVFFLNTGLAPLITDAISGIFLCADPDFKIGSRVKIGKGENSTIGVVKEVDMRKVRLIDDEGNTHVMPNSILDKDFWTVLEKTETKFAAKTSIAKEKAKEIFKNKLKK